MDLRESSADLYRQFEQILARMDWELNEEQRRVLEVFLASEEHITPSEVRERLRRRGLVLDLAAVEEALTLFCRFGIGRPRSFKGRETSYEHLHPAMHHDHCICVKCGRILEFQNQELESIQDDVAAKMGFKPLHHRMEIYGLCDACEKTGREGFPLSLASVGEWLVVESVAGGRGMKQHLADLGLNRGDRISILQSNGLGPIIVMRGDTRLGVGRGIAQKIIVVAAEVEGD